MKVGDLVKYRENSERLFLTEREGIIMKTIGLKWAKVLWKKNCIFDEHISDLIVVSKHESR